MLLKSQTLPIEINEAELRSLCQQYHIQKLALFGSVLRDDFRPDSDIDVLVEFELGHVPGFEFIDIQDRLAEIIGRPIDLNTPNALSRYFRDKVLTESKVIYAKC